MSNNLAGAAFGPPAIWNRTWNSPPRSDLLGTYQESERHLDQATGTPPGRITLEADRACDHVVSSGSTYPSFLDINESRDEPLLVYSSSDSFIF
jgi:hypothetical protein